MAPPPKRSPPRKARPAFEDDNILRADDPRPQRVAQYPAGRASARRDDIDERGSRRGGNDRAFSPSFAAGEISDAGFAPAFLYVERGPGQGQLVPVRQGNMVLGRASVADLRLQHPSISRRHAQVTRVGERFYVRDLASQNGTFVNRQKIATEVEIQLGDVVVIGAATLKLRGPLTRSLSAPELRATSPKRKRPTNNMFIGIAIGCVATAIGAVLVFMALSQKAEPANTAQRAARITIPTAEPDIIEVATPAVTTIAESPKTEATAKPAVPPETTPTRRDARDPAPSKLGVKGDVLALFSAGEGTRAISIARSNNAAGLAKDIGAFLDTLASAKGLLAAGDGRGAIAAFESAAKQERALGNGSSVYAGEIRHELSKLYTAVGEQFLREGNDSNARTAFAAALKQESSNAAAKAGLSKVGGQTAEPAAAQPTRKAAPRKDPAAARAKAIDDAFGD